MAKDPAFLFYPNDWLGGTMLLTRYQKGCYFDLLMAQFNSGPLSLETIKVLLGPDFQAWEVLRAKFKQNEQGLFFNERMESEKLKRTAFAASRSKNKLGKTKKSKNHMKIISKSLDNHMEDRNRNENRIRDGNEKTKYGETVLLKQSEYTKLCADYGQQATQAAIEYLDMYKQEKNYTTKSDYNTLKRWVMGAITKNNKTHEKPKRIDYLIATDGSKIYQKDIDFSKLGK